MKQNKFFAVLALALSLGLAGCGGDKGEGGQGGTGTNNPPIDTPPTECTKHEWGTKEIIKEPTCTEKGQSQRTCKVCGAKEDPKNVSALGHDYVDDATGGTAATCEAKGSKNQTCSRCGDKKTVELAALGHEWVDDEAGAVAATCETAGSKNQHCSRCNAKQEGVEVPALGHDYGEWTIVEGKAPTCEEKGEEKHVCSRCSKEETREVVALGHNFVLIGDDTEPEAGKAKVRLYTCSHEGCDKTSLGFKANEVSPESKTHLNIGEDGGAAFWGRPIGNALALDSTGTSINQQNNECVYCSTETGDFFEYVFDLTAQQAAELETCRCYCDARPADHLSGDFWAYNSNNTDWTPGFYIDGADEHVEMENGEYVMTEDHARAEVGAAGDALGADHMVKKGKRITDYRYVLYVDNVIQQFDPDTKVTVESSTRKEYEMPFTFHLHEGTNRISLRMAGGYRSTFYNFTFRPYTEPTPVTVNETTITVEEGKTANITSSMEGLTFASGSNSVATVDENGVVTGVKAGTTTITVSKAGNYKPARVNVTVTEPAGVFKVEAESGTIAPEGSIESRTSSYSGVTMLENFKKDATLTLTFASEITGNFKIQMSIRGSNVNVAETMTMKINNADVTLSGSVNSANSFVDTIVGEATLAAENTLVITITAENSPIKLDYFRFIPVA